MDQQDVDRVALTDGTLTTLVGGRSQLRILVHQLVGSNAGASLSTVDIKEDVTTKFSLAMAANGGGFSLELRRPWRLPEGASLKVQQSASVASYISTIWEFEPA